MTQVMLIFSNSFMKRIAQKVFSFVTVLSIVSIFLTTSLVLAQTPPADPPPTPPANNSLIENPLKNGVNTLPALIELVLEEVVMPIGAVVIIFMIIYAGFRYVVAQGNEDKLKEAHVLFKNVMIGSAIILGATAIAQIITTTLSNITDAIQ